MTGNTESMLARFRRRFWLPPRAHGEVILDRSVSFLELFYDLVYVVVISRAAHTLAGSVSWRAVGEFAAIFGLIWLAWLNGTLYYELHGREDGRTRLYVFVQMLLLAVLAVFTGDAASGGGAPFAVAYAGYLAVLSWLWYTVRRRDSDEYMAITGRYLIGMVASIAVVAASALLPASTRTLVWGALVVGWVVLSTLIARSNKLVFGVSVTDSMVERFGLFVIIVLGEMVVGVVDGLSAGGRSVRPLATGMLGLIVGFAYWWTYFDYVGSRLPFDTPRIRMRWMVAHLPVSMSIAAAGAAMVSLVRHSADAATPVATSWLLTGAVTAGLLSLVLVMSTLRDAEIEPTLYRPVSRALVGAAAISLGWGWLQPAPWLLALLLVVTLGVVWLFAVDRWLRLDEGKQTPG
ncbi:MAG: low temperature requirement protein A [Acidimicrobiia bacterium]